MSDPMNIDARSGAKVLFHNKGGYEYQQEQALKYLTLGAIYTVDFTRVHRNHTEVYLVEHPGISFNSVQFADA